MAHVFRAKSFIADATALADTETDSRGNIGVSGQVENYLETHDSGGGSLNIDEIISISSCKLSGDRVFTIVVLEDQTEGG